MSAANFRNAYARGKLVGKKLLRNMYDDQELHSVDPVLFRENIQLRELLSGRVVTNDYDPCMTDSCSKKFLCVLNIKVKHNFKIKFSIDILG